MLGSINRELRIERADLSSHQQSDPWTASRKWHLQSQLSTNWTICPPINPKSLQSRVSLEKVESWVLLCSQQHWFSFVSGRMYDLKLKISLTGINLEVQSPVCIINLWIDISLTSTNWVGDDGESILGIVLEVENLVASLGPPQVVYNRHLYLCMQTFWWLWVAVMFLFLWSTSHLGTQIKVYSSSLRINKFTSSSSFCLCSNVRWREVPMIFMRSLIANQLLE